MDPKDMRAPRLRSLFIRKEGASPKLSHAVFSKSKSMETIKEDPSFADPDSIVVQGFPLNVHEKVPKIPSKYQRRRNNSVQDGSIATYIEGRRTSDTSTTSSIASSVSSLSSNSCPNSNSGPSGSPKEVRLTSILRKPSSSTQLSGTPSALVISRSTSFTSDRSYACSDAHSVAMSPPPRSLQDPDDSAGSSQPDVFRCYIEYLRAPADSGLRRARSMANIMAEPEVVLAPSIRSEPASPTDYDSFSRLDELIGTVRAEMKSYVGVLDHPSAAPSPSSYGRPIVQEHLDNILQHQVKPFLDHAANRWLATAGAIDWSRVLQLVASPGRRFPDCELYYKALIRQLPVNIYLANRTLRRCYKCSDQEEDIEHFLISCSQAVELWALWTTMLSEAIDLPVPSATLRDVLLMFPDLEPALSSTQFFILTCFHAAALSTLWKCRSYPQSYRFVNEIFKRQAAERLRTERVNISPAVSSTIDWGHIDAYIEANLP
ncbi:uncharacterized protein BJ171DRAFT_166550 [Polychytrium aggregatum]|uniref:uncharacterized protein n=1 Tax=Polychytrium aggregatum TaxID=110093 RepID=UPI0022FF0EBD|nr:uncharacterized protein BJ171DRAFT_166550 [Polychytrium aggregatum]KAI9202741.1 hypothetical protein BJ171DRAFT_166550 [Polychytrium aggregatum]